jgi:glycosyltransferase involved in cell wall biosynthesis
VFDVRRYARDLKPDVFHAHYVHGYGTMAAMAGVKPLIVTAMGSDIGSEAERYWLVRRGARYALDRADVIAVKDEIAVSRINELTGRDKGNVIITPSCCDTTVFTPEAHSFALRWKLDTAMCKSILYTRPFNSFYKAGVLVKAIPIVMAKHEDVKFVIVEHGEQINEFKTHVKSQPWADRVVFVPRIPHSEMPAYLATCDMWVDTFYPDSLVGGHGHGTNLIEAMSCGCVAVLPQRDEYGSTDFETTVAYQPGDPISLALWIGLLLNEQEIRDILKIGAREHAIRIFDEAKVMGDMERVYERLAGVKP